MVDVSKTFPNDVSQGVINLAGGASGAGVTCTTRGKQSQTSTKIEVKVVGTASSTTFINPSIAYQNNGNSADEGIYLTPLARLNTATGRIRPLYDLVPSIQGYVLLNEDGTCTVSVVSGKVYSQTVSFEFF